MVGRRDAMRTTALGLLVLVSSWSAVAQTYPSRRITIVVPYTAGSGFDTVARTVGQKFSERSGQPVVIDNKPGASGNLGAEAVANAPPDGYTLLQTGTPLTLSASLTKAQRFDPVASFTPLGTVATSGLALTVTQSFPAATLEDLLREARANPGKLNYSSPGTGTLQHLGMELFKHELKLDVVHVPYRGAATALTDLLTGQVQFTFLPVHSARPHVQSGKLRMLAVAGTEALDLCARRAEPGGARLPQHRLRAVVRFLRPRRPAGCGRCDMGAGACRHRGASRREGGTRAAGHGADLVGCADHRRAREVGSGALATGGGAGRDQAGMSGVTSKRRLD